MITKVVSLTFVQEKNETKLVIITIKCDHKSGKSDLWAAKEQKMAGNHFHKV